MEQNWFMTGQYILY